jgi:hypothetical protein
MAEVMEAKHWQARSRPDDSPNLVDTLKGAVTRGGRKYGVDNLTNERHETSTPMSQFMLKPLSPHSKIDARRFETVDASDG